MYYDAPTGFTEMYGGTLVRNGLVRPRARRSRAAGFVLSALVIVTTSLTGACSGSSAAKSGQLEQTTLKIGIVGGEIGALPVYLGRDENLFGKSGISLTINDSFKTDQEALKALENGTVDLVYGDYARYFEAQQNGEIQLELIAEGYLAGDHSVSVATLETTKLSTPQQFASVLLGKGIAVPTTGADPQYDFSVPTLMFESEISALSNTTLNKQQAMHVLKPVLQSVMKGRLNSRTNDAAVMTEPAYSEAASQNRMTVGLDLTAGGNADFPMGGYFTARDFDLGHPRLFAAFTAALNIAKQEASSQAQASAALQKDFGISAVTVTGISLGKFPTTVNVNRLQRVVDAMNQNGFNLAPFFNPASIVPPGSLMATK